MPDGQEAIFRDIRMQDGPQRAFGTTSADIAIYGGAAFGGKTYALLIEPLRHTFLTKGFGAVIFRRTNKIIRQEGGLWAESETIYPLYEGMPRESVLKWDFPPYGNTISLAGMELERNKYDWKSTQIPLICFDQLEEFSEGQFFYLLSRNRSQCGVSPYVRATCNPDPDSFVAKLCSWWIGDDGYAIPERSGVVRYFTRRGDDLVFGGTRAEVVAECPDIVDPVHEIKSLTFIAASFEDNKIGTAGDPGYIGNLRALSMVERERLLRGNWKVRAAAGMYFRRSWFEVVDTLPAGERRTCRAWDLAATTVKEGADPSFTASVRMSRDKDGTYYIEHAEHFRESPSKVETMMRNTATQDGRGVTVRIPQDPGQAGKSQAKRFVSMLAGHNVRAKPVTGDKVTRASGLSAQVEAGNVKVLQGAWNDEFFNELENFPDGAHDDLVDAASDAFDHLTTGPRPIRSGHVIGAY